MSLTVAEKEILTTTAPIANGRREVYYPETDGEPMGETDYHIKTIMMLHQILELFFRDSTDVRIFTDIMFYYEEGNPQKVVAPDVMFVRGVGQHLRRTYKVWEEKVPDVVFEISSRKTWKEDFQKKYLIYQGLGIKEYYIFDPEYNYLKEEPFSAYHLKGESLESVKIRKGRVFSPELGLEIVDTGETLRLFDVDKQIFVPTAQELGARNEELGAENEELKKALASLKGDK